MNEKEQNLPELDLEDIMKEFSASEEELLTPAEEAVSHDIADVDALLDTLEDTPAETVEAPAAEPIPAPEPAYAPPADTGDTRRLDDLSSAIQEMREETPAPAISDTQRLDKIMNAASKLEAEPPKSETIEEEDFETPIEPPKPIIFFRPKSRLRDLKRQLIAGPEKRYYELTEQGVGKLQVAMFLCLVVILASVGGAVLYSAGMVPESRMRLMVFGQILAMLVGALLGSQQILEGLFDLFRGRFTLNTLLLITFLACCADAVLCLQELRVPLCAAFTLEVFMSLWSVYQHRATETGMMDTLRKAVRLDSLVKSENFYEGKPAFLRGEGEVSDIMDTYQEVSGPERGQNIYAFISLLASVGVAVMAGLFHGLSMALQILSTTLLVAVPASFFVSYTRPMALLERRFHALGVVLCGWKGVKGLSGKALFPLKDEDLFPLGSTKMNGVKFYGDRNPEQTIAYAAALMRANGGVLAPIFDQLLTNRNGVRYQARNIQFYPGGGIGGEVNSENVLMGSPEFLKELGVEIPESAIVKQAVYVAIGGSLSGLFAITYSRMKLSAMGMTALNGCRKISPLILAQDFMMTAPFLKEKFGTSPRRAVFPIRADRDTLSAKAPADELPALALTTQEGLAPAAYAISGAFALRTASTLGLVIHILGGVIGILIMAALAALGNTELLEPVHILLYQLIWTVPGILVTFWTKTV